MRLRDNTSGYDYICTHMDNFKVTAKDSSIWIEQISSIFIVKWYGPRICYLGNDYAYHDTQYMWIYGSQTYAKEAVARVEIIYGCLSKESTPLPVINCHAELETFPLLGIDDHHKFQMLLWMLQCFVTICRPELFQLVASLDHFCACPREGQLDLAMRNFGYIKTTPRQGSWYRLQANEV